MGWTAFKYVEYFPHIILQSYSSTFFSQIIFTNVGNPHALGQKPLTFPRQVEHHSLSLSSFGTCARS